MSRLTNRGSRFVLWRNWLNTWFGKSPTLSANMQKMRRSRKWATLVESVRRPRMIGASSASFSAASPVIFSMVFSGFSLSGS